jgi:hypothetical protein
MDGWKNEWNGWLCGPIFGSLRWINEWMDGMDKWMDGSVYGWYVKNEWLDG